MATSDSNAARFSSCLLLLITASILCHPTTAHPQDDLSQTVKVVAEGCAPGTTPASRTEALRKAREEAVWLWLEGTLDEKRTQDFMPLMDYLDTYTASSRMTQVRTERGQTCVEAEVFLYDWPLRTDAATVLFKTRRTPPTVAFLFVENDESAGARRFQESTGFSGAVVEAFRSKGFHVVEPHTTRAIFGERELLAILEAGPNAMARFGAGLNADAVVSLESRMSIAPSGAVTLARAQMTAVVVSATDATVLDQHKSVAEVTAADPASGFRFALDDVVYKLRDRIVVAAVLAARGVSDEVFDLTIEGVPNVNEAERIAEHLRAVAGVAQADVLAARNGMARIRFRYDGRVGYLVDFLESGGAGPPMRAMRVVDHEMHFKLTG